jgi:hypothetical protein
MWSTKKTGGACVSSEGDNFPGLISGPTADYHQHLASKEQIEAVSNLKLSDMQGAVACSHSGARRA